MKKLLLYSFFVFAFSSAKSQYYTAAQLDSIETNKLASEGDLYLDTANQQYFIGLTHGKLGKVFPYNSSVCDLLKPKINSQQYKTSISNTLNIRITGFNFTGNSLTVFIGGGVIINSINQTTNTEIIANITTPSNTDTLDIVVTNSCGSDTITNALEIKTTTWKDLKAGGDFFTIGDGPGNDIRHKTGLSVFRNMNGMYFTGINLWQTWVKFESCQFTRGTGITVEWIFSHDNTFMLGISGLTTNENSTTQYREGAVLAYFNGTGNFWGLFGSSPSAGTQWTQAAGMPVTNNTIYKLKIENDGSTGNVITLYQLPSANSVDWNDETTVITTVTSSNGNTQNTLVPCLLPRSSAANYFIALRVI